ncbi:MAG: CotH kinase family protein [Planctomycetaceae bacterium]
MSEWSKILLLLLLAIPASAAAQPPVDERGPDRKPPGMPGGESIEILNKFDRDGNGWLKAEERVEAAEYLQKNLPHQRRRLGPGPNLAKGSDSPGRLDGKERPALRGNSRGFIPPGGLPPGRFPLQGEAKRGIEIIKSSVSPVEGDLYDVSALRTIFIDFENENWESELEIFHNTDVDVPALLTVDGKEYPNCGIRFRGMSSYHMVPSGYKRSLNVSIDMANEDQRINGYRTLNLLNGASDNSMMSTVLYSYIARKYTVAPKANFVRVVINGEDWGIYTNVQQFNKEFLKENYGSSKGLAGK